MKRYTTKRGLIDCGGSVKELGAEIYKATYNKNIVEAHRKLAALENAEEELGIDLVTLLKGHKNGIYVKDKSYSPVVHKIEASNLIISLLDFGFIIQELYFEDLDCVMDLTGRKWYSGDYGRTWALTKKELEVEK